MIIMGRKFSRPHPHWEQFEFWGLTCQNSEPSTPSKYPNQETWPSLAWLVTAQGGLWDDPTSLWVSLWEVSGLSEEFTVGSSQHLKIGLWPTSLRALWLWILPLSLGDVYVSPITQKCLSQWPESHSSKCNHPEGCGLWLSASVRR